VRSLLGFITHNWKLKLAAFALAMLLWVTVTADQIAIRWLLVPVAVEVQQPGLELLQGPTPPEVQVRIRGPRREFWDLGLNRPELRLVLNDVEEGTHSYTLDPQAVQIPQRVARGLSPIDVRPSRVTLSIRRVAVAEVPVQLQVGTGLRQEMALVDTLRVQPGRVRITGPAAQVNRVQRVQTRPVDLSREEGTFERTVAIDTAGLAGLEVSPGTVQVSGQIERAVQRVIPEVPVQSPAGVLIVPGAVDVQVWGAESVVRALNGGALRVTVPPESIPATIAPGGVSVPVRIERLPPGVRAVPEPRSVRVLAAPQPTVPPEIRPVPGPVLRPPTPPDTTPAAAEPESEAR
jgi:hypothetical protein